MPRRHAADEFALDSVLDFLRLLWTVEHGLQRESKRMEARLGVTGPQRLVLKIVGRFPDLSAGQLANIVQLHPSTITGILQRLVSKGLLERKRDPEDNRRVRLRLKPQGQPLTRVSKGSIEKAVSRVLTRTSAARVRAAREVLSAVAVALGDANGPGTIGSRRAGSPAASGRRMGRGAWAVEDEDSKRNFA